MALIKCPECGKEISDKASSCINCGYPLDIAAKPIEKNEIKINKQKIDQEAPSKFLMTIKIGYAIIAILLIFIFGCLIKKKVDYNNMVNELSDNKRPQKETTQVNTPVVDNRTPEEKITTYLLDRGYKTSNNKIYTLYYNTSSMWEEIDFRKGLYYKSNTGSLSMLTEYYYRDETVKFTYKFGSYWGTINWSLKNSKYSCESSVKNWCEDNAQEYVDNNMTKIQEDFTALLKKAGITLEDIKKIN